ncbi:MAG: phosphoribosylformylglycinamidine synthase subunit PurL [Actinomycetota bacterium]|nr:phosphoribosylformylglycinamidine synthase subunit PurL [Actinomycetota bacterium]
MKIYRIEVGFKEGVTDALGESVKRSISEDLMIDVDGVRTVEVYTIAADFAEADIIRIKDELLTDPVIQISSERALFSDFDLAIEVGYKPGVTDNVAMTTKEGIADLLGASFPSDGAVHTSRIYLIDGDLTKEEAGAIATGLLANPIIEDYFIFTPKDGSHKEEIIKGHLSAGKTKGYRVVEVDLDVSDDELLRISSEGTLSLAIKEMVAIRDYFKEKEVIRERKEVGLSAKPTDVELEMLAQTWSEHCKHKIFNARIVYEEDGKTEKIDGLFSTYIKRATEEVGKDFLVSVFEDNAGIISFTDDYNLVFKVETHNHPSALDPYGGALTGIVGVNRDPLGTGLGADLIFNTDVFCFGPPDFPSGKLPSKVLSPKRIFKGVRRGVEHGGNKMGIPTVNGAILFDEAYVYNPLVYCGTGGIMPKVIKGRESHIKKIEDGDLIVMVGGRIGKDGIHGATFSSVKLEETTSTAAVQIGAPIVQKKMMDALLEARDEALFDAITDNGAGGLSSSVGEMAELSDGCLVDIEKAPVKYPGLDPWELWVSESQERMTVAVSPKKVDAFLNVMKKWDVEATVIGEFKSSGKVHVRCEGKTVLFLDMEFVHGGLPKDELVAKWSEPKETGPFEECDSLKSLKAILSSYNVCSKEWVIRQYDHEVKGASVVKPLVGAAEDGPSDAAVLKPLFGRDEGVVVSNGINPSFGKIDPYAMAVSAVDEAVRNAACVGADPEHIAILDNFCWGNPILSFENPQGDFKLAQLVRAAKGCHDAAVGLGTPFISGKDSFHNEYELGGETLSIPPTLLISAIGRIGDVRGAVTMDAKRAGDKVYLLGVTRSEMGGSHYNMVNGLDFGKAPLLDAPAARRMYNLLHSAMNEGLVASCHDLSEGGLAVAAAETAFAGGLGMEIDLRNLKTEGDLTEAEMLFSESNARLLVTVAPDKAESFEAKMAGSPFSMLGKIKDEPLLAVIGRSGSAILSYDIFELKAVWKAPLDW